jgi:hypothetical protein
MIKRLPFDPNIRGIRYARVDHFHCSMHMQRQDLPRRIDRPNLCSTLRVIFQAVTCRYAAFFRPFTFAHLAR